MRNKMNKSKKKSMLIKGNLMMLIVTMLWGSSYLFMKMGLDTLQGFNLVGLRFSIAFIVAGAVFYKRLLRVNVKTVKYGLILGFILFSMMSVVTIGVQYTSISNAGFIFSLTVIFVPLMLAILYKKVPEFQIIIGVLLAVIGIGLLTLHELEINNGDVLIVFGALSYAIYILITDKVTKHVDSISLGILQLGFAGAFGLLFSFIFEETQLPNTNKAWIAILALSIFCSAIGFIGQTIAQNYTTPTHTGLIFSLEPVFAAIFAFLFVSEVLPKQGYIGAALILIGVLFSKVDINKFFVSRNLIKNAPTVK